MRRLWLGLGCALLAGCADFFKPSDDSEPLPALNALDSAAIAKMKISMGVWNGDVRDWIGTYSQAGRVKSLNLKLNRLAKVDFPDTGLEYVEEVDFGVAFDTLKVGGFSRLSSVTRLAFFGIDGYKMNAWPRGVYLNGNVKDFSLGEGGDGDR